MQTVIDILQQDWINSLSWMLLHSLWQHALIAFLCMLLLLSTRQAYANTRYVIAFGSLVMSTLISAVTFIRYQQANSEIVMKPAQQGSATPFFSTTDVASLLNIVNNNIGSITLVWLAGILLYSLKILFDYRFCQHLKNQHLTATPQKWQEIFENLAVKSGITSNIELRISLIAVTPCVIGHLKPVVLLPMGLLLGMSQQQIEVILLHELAHVRRNDYLLGFLQTIIKASFFFNPFLHWISSQIDKEREHACDDIAVEISQNPLLLSNTLKELAEMNINQKIAMNITGNKLLLNRITRLFNKNEKSATTKNNVAASLLILFTSLALTICVNAAPDKVIDKTISIDVADTAVQDVMKEVNKKCGTNEILSAKNNDNLTLRLDEISCNKATQLLKDFAAEKPVQE